MAVDVKVPGVGESVQEGMIQTWHKATGDWIEMDEVLLELETDKATVEVQAEVSGVVEVIAAEGDVVKVGDVIAKIDTDAQKPAGAAASSAEPAAAPSEPASEPTTPAPTAGAHPAQSPAVRRMAAEENIDTSKIPGTGRGGRVTKEDLIKNKGAAPAPSQAKAPSAPVVEETLAEGRTDIRKPMTMLRRRIAERLLESQSNNAILTTFNEVDMTSIMDLRKKYKDAFQKRFDIKLGFMGFFLKASEAALQDFPLVNSYIDGTDIVGHNYVDIGVAVSTPKGLMVPIIRDVQNKSLADVELSIAAYADKARNNKISIDDLQGGTFTVSNGGVFGSLLSTPIINPPQSAILGMHKTQMRPMVMPDGSIEARPMMYLALSYDHRIIDGKEAVGFLVKIKDMLEDPARFLLGV